MQKPIANNCRACSSLPAKLCTTPVRPGRRRSSPIASSKARRAFEEAIAELRRLPGLTGVVHSFAGSEEQARQLFGMGFFLGLGGPVTYERARRIRRVATSMPLEHLLLETDAPDQPGSGRRGERNEPAFLVDVLECIARLRDQAPEEIAAQTSANARRLFRLPD